MSGDEYAMNGRSADYLVRETATVGEHPRWAAGDIIDRSPAGIAKARDLVEQIGALDPRRAGEYASGILDYLTTDESKRAFLGGDPPEPRPLGILAAEAQERGQNTGATESPASRRRQRSPEQPRPRGRRRPRRHPVPPRAGRRGQADPAGRQ